MSFVLCSRCQRHVRADDTRCPFCARRAARVGVALAAASALVGCQEPHVPDAPATPPAEPTPAPVVVEVPAPSDDATPVDPTEEPEEETVAKPEEEEVDPEDGTVDPAPEEMERPVVARYGIAPRPRPTAKPQPPQQPPRPVARYGVAPRW